MPITEHSTSRPRAAASTIASESCSNAVSSAAGSSSASATRTIPTEEPSRAGLTNTGSPSAPQPGEHAVAVGRELLSPDRAVLDLRQAGVRHQLLEHHLVHAQRRGEHAGADVRDVEALEQALHGAVLAERPVQHREHDVDPLEAPPGRDRDAAPSRRHTPSRPISIAIGSCPASASPRGPTPPRRAKPRARRSGLPRAPRRELSSLLLLRRRRGAGRRGRRGRRGRARGRRRWWSSASRTYLPTTIVTLAPFLAWVSAAGFWLRTIPFWLWLVTVCCCTVAGNPRAPSVALAAPLVLPTTFGTATVGGALATTSVTVEPLGAGLAAGRALAEHGARRWPWSSPGRWS